MSNQSILPAHPTLPTFSLNAGVVGVRVTGDIMNPGFKDALNALEDALNAEGIITSGEACCHFQIMEIPSLSMSLSAPNRNLAQPVPALLSSSMQRVKAARTVKVLCVGLGSSSDGGLAGGGRCG